MALRLGIIWFVVMAGFGCFYPYYGLYLRQVLGLSATEVGTVIAMQPLVGLVAQPIWGQLADRTGSRRRALALAILGFAGGALWIAQASSFRQAAVATAFFALFSTSMLSMTTAVSLAALPDGPRGFGRVRMFGTLGYLAAVVAFPWLALLLAARFGRAEGAGLPWLFAATAACALPAAALVMRLPAVASLRLQARQGDFRRLLGHPPIRRLVLFAFGSNLAMQGPINLFPVLLASRGGGVEELRFAWILMLTLEIPLVAFAGATLQKLGPRGLLAMGLLGEGVRWTATAAMPSLGGTVALQLLHGLSAMGVLVGIPLYLELAVPARLRSTGQTVISALGLGIGWVASSLLGGFLYDAIGSHAPFLAGGLLAFALAAGLWVFLPPPYRPEEAAPLEAAA